MVTFTIKDYALTTLKRLKLFLALPNDGGLVSDDVLIKWINSISSEVIKLTKRVIVLTTFTEEKSPVNSRKLILKQRPIISVTSVKVSGEDITDFHQTDSSDLQGILLRDCGWAYCDYIDVVYEAGYTLPTDADDVFTLPEELEELVFNVVADLMALESKEARGLSSVTEGEVTYKFRSFVKGRLNSYMSVINLNSDICI